MDAWKDALGEELLLALAVMIGFAILIRLLSPLWKPFILVNDSIHEMALLKGRVENLETSKSKLFENLDEVEQRLINRMDRMEKDNHNAHLEVNHKLTGIAQDLAVIATSMTFYEKQASCNGEQKRKMK